MRDAFDLIDAHNRAIAIHETFGHLEPKPGKYAGRILFANGDYGDCVSIETKFQGLNDCPGFYEDLNEQIYKWCNWEKAEVGVYVFNGYYQRFKNGGGRFIGKPVKVVI